MGLSYVALHLRDIFFLNFLSIPVRIQEVKRHVKIKQLKRLTNPSIPPSLHYNHNVCDGVQIKPDGPLTAFSWTAGLPWLEEKALDCSLSDVRVIFCAVKPNRAVYHSNMSY